MDDRASSIDSRTIVLCVQYPMNVVSSCRWKQGLQYEFSEWSLLKTNSCRWDWGRDIFPTVGVQVWMEKTGVSECERFALLVTDECWMAASGDEQCGCQA
ncbi:MAG: hypothetical protein ACLRS8_18310 [Parabacteroides merdae]